MAFSMHRSSSASRVFASSFPCLKFCLACASSFGRSRLPTWSARKGGFMLAFPRIRSRIQTALGARSQDALAGHREGRGAQRNAMLVGGVPDALERADQDLVEPQVDFVLGPEEG